MRLSLQFADQASFLWYGIVFEQITVPATSTFWQGELVEDV